MSTVTAPDLRAVVVQQRTTIVATRDASSTVVVTQQRGPGAVVVTRGAPGLKGDKGDKGDPGGSAGAAYTHAQPTPLSVWTVAHNLGRWPSVTVTDHLGQRIEPDVKYLDNNLAQVTHSTPLAGFAYCN